MGADVAAAGSGPGPIFVVGSMRSGSTLLRLILDSHPRIALGPETGFMGGLVGVRTIPNWKHGPDWHTRIGWSLEELDERLREFYGGMFERYARSQGKSRWGDKTPFHTAHLATMAKVFPDAVFIGIVRHPGAVARSLERRFHYRFADAVSYWAATNLDLVRGAASLGDRVAVCRYEELVAQPEPVLRELLDFVGEPWSPQVLEHQRVQKKQGAPRAVDGLTVTRDAIDDSRATGWADEVSPDDLATLVSHSELARFFGYEPDDPQHLVRLVTDSDRHLVSGDLLGRRRSEWRDRVDFDARPPALFVEADVTELAARLAHAEAALARVQSRRAVRLADAVRRVQFGRSWQDVQAVRASLRRQRD